MTGELGSGRGFAAHKLSLKDIARHMQGALSYGAIAADEEEYEEEIVQAVSTDTRAVRGGDVFVAIKGERFDGHDFASDACARGAIACVVDREVGPLPMNRPVIRVSDTVKALGALALALRNEVDPTVVAVTGSVGKTTVKNLLYSILSSAHRSV
ncbi:MAG: Mur ligase domain-containing protein, partial [Deltaproteobacteria bacterium]|nr:Mur ligase domain-containing protein [Deltaproteobacteria bacterium]